MASAKPLNSRILVTDYIGHDGSVILVITLVIATPVTVTPDGSIHKTKG